MERLATGKANANAGDRSSYVAMADTFRLDFVGTKAGIKGASVVMGYLETGMRVLDSASGLLSRLQELAVLGANDTNTDADALAINTEAEAIADEFHRLMSTSTYKGKDVFVAAAGGEYVSMGGRDAEMTADRGHRSCRVFSVLPCIATPQSGGPVNGRMGTSVPEPPRAAAAARERAPRCQEDLRTARNVSVVTEARDSRKSPLSCMQPARGRKRMWQAQACGGANEPVCGRSQRARNGHRPRGRCKQVTSHSI